MTLLTEELMRGGINQSLIVKAKAIFSELTLPSRLSGKIVDKYVRKALRVGAWRTLAREARALLIFIRRWGPIKSPTLKSVLKALLLQIELHTLKGRALLYGIIITLKEFTSQAHSLIKRVSRLIAIGISYLNNPLTLRIYG